MANFRLIKSVVAASLMAAGMMSAAQAATTAGGVVHFKGQIVNTACAISAGSTDQIVNLGTYRSANFKDVGDVSSSVPFNIQLEDCDTEVSKAVTIAFNGPSDATDNTVLSVSNIGGGSGAASGVGIEISDSLGKVMKPDGSNFSSPHTLNDGSNTVNFTARYKSTSATVTPGQADADAVFTMQYQ